MRLHVELIEDQLDAMSRRGREVPHAVRVGRIVVRIVGTVDGAKRARDLVLALALLAVVSVLVQ